MCGPGQDFSRACVLRELGELARNVGDHRAAQEYYEQAVWRHGNSPAIWPSPPGPP
jgi:hypothetical protein